MMVSRKYVVKVPCSALTKGGKPCKSSKVYYSDYYCQLHHKQLNKITCHVCTNLMTNKDGYCRLHDENDLEFVEYCQEDVLLHKVDNMQSMPKQLIQVEHFEIGVNMWVNYFINNNEIIIEDFSDLVKYGFA